MSSSFLRLSVISGMLFALPTMPLAEGPPVGEKGNFDVPITQEEIAGGTLTLTDIQRAGVKVFSTPFNRYDGMGDGFSDKTANKSAPGNRPTLQANPNEGHGALLRINGLDSQTCLECHSIVNNSSIPAKFGIGGVGGLAASAFPGVTNVDPDNEANNNYAAFNGRIINPPFVFGSGGVELLAKEMTAELRQIANDALAAGNIGIDNKFALVTSHGVDFGEAYWREATVAELAEAKEQEEMGSGKANPDANNCSSMGGSAPSLTAEIVAPDSGNAADGRSLSSEALMMFIAPRHVKYRGKYLPDYVKESYGGNAPSPTEVPLDNLILDTSLLQGVNADLIVKPFGRKGNNVTTRDFDCGAIRFHQGIEPVEVVGLDNDNDDDGVVNEITIGQMSALEIFNTTLAPSCQAASSSDAGLNNFETAGCAECHKPVLETQGSVLDYSFPLVPSDPTANVFYQVDLGVPANLRNPDGSPSAAGFSTNGNGGISVPLFSDLKVHDMGIRLQETLEDPNVTDLDNRSFITARLWGVADTAPYMHDGRAQTLTEAIDWHGGDAAAARTSYFAMTEDDRRSILDYLRTLHTPGNEMCP